MQIQDFRKEIGKTWESGLLDIHNPSILSSIIIHFKSKFRNHSIKTSVKGQF